MSFTPRTKPNDSFSDRILLTAIYTLIQKIYKEWMYDSEITYDEDGYTYDSSTIETTTSFIDNTKPSTNWN